PCRRCEGRRVFVEEQFSGPRPNWNYGRLVWWIPDDVRTRKISKSLAAGSAIVPFLNWFTEIQNERDDLRYWDMQNMGDPEKDKDRLREASPIFFIDQIRVPVQMIAGAHDPRCPPSETLQAQNELRKHGKQDDVVI